MDPESGSTDLNASGSTSLHTWMSSDADIADDPVLKPGFEPGHAVHKRHQHAYSRQHLHLCI